MKTVIVLFSVGVFILVACSAFCFLKASSYMVFLQEITSMKPTIGGEDFEHLEEVIGSLRRAYAYLFFGLMALSVAYILK